MVTFGVNSGYIVNVLTEFAQVTFLGKFWMPTNLSSVELPEFVLTLTKQRIEFWRNEAGCSIGMQKGSLSV